MYLPRQIESTVHSGLKNNPVTAILGPRQCGKSTLVKQCIQAYQDAVYLDLERPSDIAKLQDPEAYFEAQQNKLICLDEIQQRPELFQVMRSHVDITGGSGVFLITGSASPELLRQGSESLAGRIHLNELTPFGCLEIPSSTDLRIHLTRGGFPRSFLAETQAISYKWREDFIQTFLERDIGRFGINAPTALVRRLWRMLAHIHGQILNYSQLANSLGVTGPTVRKYIDLLMSTFMIRILEPYFANIKKRIVKSPKVYIRDTGILQTLLGIQAYDTLLGHPVYGALWEGYVIENLLQAFPAHSASFYRTAGRAEIDLVLKHGEYIIAIECKASKAPHVSQGFYQACEDIKATHKLIIAPVNESWPVSEGIEVHYLLSAIDRIRNMD